MAKAVIQTAYGKGPDRSYFGGCSNGGRHALVAAARYADQYDGFLAGDPGLRLPLAAIANIAGYQTYAEPRVHARQRLDRLHDRRAPARLERRARQVRRARRRDRRPDPGHARRARRRSTSNRDVPTCAGARDGTCLSAAQKTGIAQAVLRRDDEHRHQDLRELPYDTGLATAGWSFWKFTAPPILDSGAVGFIWQVPPADPRDLQRPDLRRDEQHRHAATPSIQATNATYTENSLSFMTPPHPTDLSALRSRGAKIMIYHGTSDPIFSSDDSVACLRRPAREQRRRRHRTSRACTSSPA